MFIEEILKSQNNTVVEGSYLILDASLKEFSGKEGSFLTFKLQDKTGMIWAKIWDNATLIEQQLKNISIVTIKGRTNIYNNKTSIIVDKIKEAEQEDYDIKNLVQTSLFDPELMWKNLCQIMSDSLIKVDYKNIWDRFVHSNMIDKFKLWPGGKGFVHHAYRHGLLEHTLSVVKIIKMFKENLDITFDFEKTILGSVLHDIGKIDAYTYDNVKTQMSIVGRLHNHTIIGYYIVRNIIDEIVSSSKEQIIEDIGHIILSHHGSNESISKPMTIEAKLVAFADNLDADLNYMTLQLEHNADDTGWIFDTLNNQFYFKRPEIIKRKLLKPKEKI
ncbi:MAG: HD domain-containing protein [Candidatus Nanoarchaeia archaeon]|jgi:3'-5' exoribonuclease|nr:HD domain-containing protein [Candidatus Nanoarchaeia archaeon]